MQSFRIVPDDIIVVDLASYAWKANPMGDWLLFMVEYRNRSGFIDNISQTRYAYNIKTKELTHVYYHEPISIKIKHVLLMQLHDILRSLS